MSQREPPSLLHGTPQELEDYNRQLDKEYERPLADEIAGARHNGEAKTETKIKPKPPSIMNAKAAKIFPPIKFIVKGYT